jgi:hypothetical protein
MCCGWGAQPEVRLDLDAQNGPARIWVQQEPIQHEIAYLFRKFLKDFADEATGELLYKQRMRDMCTSTPPSPAHELSYHTTVLVISRAQRFPVPRQFAFNPSFPCTSSMLPAAHIRF